MHTYQNLVESFVPNLVTADGAVSRISRGLWLHTRLARVEEVLRECRYP